MQSMHRYNTKCKHTRKPSKETTKEMDKLRSIVPSLQSSHLALFISTKSKESNSWLSQSQKRWKNEKPIAMGWLPFAGSAWQTNLHHPWARNEILRVLHNLRWPIMYVLCNCKIIVLTGAAPLDNDFSCCCLMCWFIMILDLQRPPPWQFFYMGRNQERTTILSTFNKVILYWCAARPSTFNLHQIRCHCSSSASLQHNNNATSLSYGRPSTSSWFQRRELVL